MKTSLELDRYTNEQLHRLHDAAHELAPRLRREAMDRMWQGIADVLSAWRARAQRAAERFTRDLRRHVQRHVASQRFN